MENIVYKVNDDGTRIDLKGEFEPSQPGEIWMRIESKEGEIVPLKRGDRIHYSGADLPSDDGNYIIDDANLGIYRLKKCEAKESK